MDIAVPKWGPRLARLYSADVKRLEALHAGRLSPGAVTWEQAVEALHVRAYEQGPRKGVQLLTKAAAYLEAVTPDERAHLLIGAKFKSRYGALLIATYSVGDHPDARVQEAELGLNIDLHVVACSRSRPLCISGIPVAFISKHAVSRLFERGCDITENSHATDVFARVAMLGFISQRVPKHIGGGMNLAFSDLLLTGAMHDFQKTWPRGSLDECVFDVRTVLEADQLGDSQWRLMEQGRIDDAPPGTVPDDRKIKGDPRDWFQITESIVDPRQPASFPYPCLGLVIGLDCNGDWCSAGLRPAELRKRVKFIHGKLVGYATSTAVEEGSIWTGPVVEPIGEEEDSAA